MKRINQILLTALLIIPFLFLGCEDQEKKELTKEDVTEIETQFSDFLDYISENIPHYEMGEPEKTEYSLIYSIKTPDFIDFTHLSIITTVIQIKYDYDIIKFWTKVDNNSYLMIFTYDRFICEIIYNDNDKIICIEFRLN